MSTYFALVDCNNFYASCERSFNPKIWNSPIVVLSNNDGCVIARSNEAKTLGIGMGTPFWEIKSLVLKHKIQVYSSNYQLYGDMSSRVMNILQDSCMDIEVYSIDEAFLKLNPFKINEDQLMQENIILRTNILRATGIPVSIGIAPTKTLAKLANHLAKKSTQNGVYILEPDSDILKDIPIEKVWGIGKSFQRRLAKTGVKSVADLTKISRQWMASEFGVVGVRLLKELQGFSCYDLETPISQRKNIMVSRSFSKDVFQLSELIEGISTYATRLGEKLRRHNQSTGQLTIFLMANPFRNLRPDQKKYFSRTIELPLATCATNELISWSSKVIRFLFEEGTNYKKVGILAGRLRPSDYIQGNLFVSLDKEKKLKSLMKSMDAINTLQGRNKVYFASCGEKKKTKWARKEQWCSPRYTTRWKDILKIKI